MAICACDFIFFPILWSMTQAVYRIVPFVQWQPLTLQGAGLFHIAMGAVLGITSYGRTREKMAGAELGGLYENFGTNAGTTYIPPGQGQVNVSNQSPSNSEYNNSFPSPNMNNNVFNNSPISSNSNNFASPVSTPQFDPRLSGPPQTFPEK
jgi:hypothetical protein